MKVKVLPLDLYYQHDHLFSEQMAEERREDGTPYTGALFNRPGLYMTKDTCWAEAWDGAWVHDRDTFKRELRGADRPRYNTETFHELAKLLKAPGLPPSVVKVLRKELQEEVHARALRSTERNTKLFIHKYRRDNA